MVVAGVGAGAQVFFQLLTTVQTFGRVFVWNAPDQRDVNDFIIGKTLVILTLLLLLGSETVSHPGCGGGACGRLRGVIFDIIVN